MASYSSNKKRKKRTLNFSTDENGILARKVEQHWATLQSKDTKAATNRQKDKIWEEITKEINKSEDNERTINEVKDKWKNLLRLVKKKIRASEQPTGGDPRLKRFSSIEEKIRRLILGTPNFDGLNGFETGTVVMSTLKQDDIHVIQLECLFALKQNVFIEINSKLMRSSFSGEFRHV